MYRTIDSLDLFLVCIVKYLDVRLSIVVIYVAWTWHVERFTHSNNSNLIAKSYKNELNVLIRWVPLTFKWDGNAKSPEMVTQCWI